MTPFDDAIDRLFEELVHQTWGTPQPVASRHRQSLPAATLELQLPIASASCEHVAFTTEGQRLILTVRQRAAECLEHAAAVMTAGAEHRFQQSIVLPADTEPATIEVLLDAEPLRLRIALRRRSNV